MTAPTLLVELECRLCGWSPLDVDCACPFCGAVTLPTVTDFLGWADLDPEIDRAARLNSSGEAPRDPEKGA